MKGKTWIGIDVAQGGHIDPALVYMIDDDISQAINRIAEYARGNVLRLEIAYGFLDSAWFVMLKEHKDGRAEPKIWSVRPILNDAIRELAGKVS